MSLCGSVATNASGANRFMGQTCTSGCGMLRARCTMTQPDQQKLNLNVLAKAFQTQCFQNSVQTRLLLVTMSGDVGLLGSPSKHNITNFKNHVGY